MGWWHVGYPWERGGEGGRKGTVDVREMKCPYQSCSWMRWLLIIRFWWTVRWEQGIIYFAPQPFCARRGWGGGCGMNVLSFEWAPFLVVVVVGTVLWRWGGYYAWQWQSLRGITVLLSVSVERYIYIYIGRPPTPYTASLVLPLPLSSSPLSPFRAHATFSLVVSFPQCPPSRIREYRSNLIRSTYIEFA